MISGANIFTKLTSITALSNVIGSRIYPQYNRSRDKVYPLIIYKVENLKTDEYYTGGTTGLEKCDLTFAVVATTHAVADSLAQVIQTALNNDSSMWGTTKMQDCSLKDDGINDDVITNEETEDILYYVKEIQFELIFNN